MMLSRRFPALGTNASGLAPILLIALWLGVVTGFGEVILLGIRKYIQDMFVFTGADVIWTAPLFTGLLFALLFIPVAIAAHLFPRYVTRSRAAGLGIFLGAFSWFYLYPQFHRVAALLLAAGIGFQASRLLSSREERLMGFARRTLPVLLITAVLLGAGLHLSHAIIEKRAIDRLPEASSGTPNVLLIVLDTVRGFNMSLYGYPRQTTPEIDAFAAGGFRFDRAISTAPWTLPSHASMFTGRQVHELETDWLVPLGTRYPTVAEALRSRGYVTAGFVGNTNYTSAETGLARGFIHYVDYTLSPGLIARNSALFRVLARNRTLRRLVGDQDALGRRSADDINHAFLSWLDDEKRPFFAFLNYYDVHRPYLPPEPWASRFVPDGTEPDPRLARNAKPGDQDRVEKTQWAENAYDGALAYLDDRIGILLDELKSRGVLENTLVIITSDHGEEFGEHGLFDHGNSLYRQAVQVPLILVGPGLVPRGNATPTVSLSDIPATVMDLVAGNSNHRFPGTSLSRFWAGDTTPSLVRSEVRKVIRQPEWYPASKGDLSSVFVGRYRLIRNMGTGAEELYDVLADPRETTNIIDTGTGRRVLPALRESVMVDLSSPPSVRVADRD
ncbi:MAG: sulfatase [Gemmatimonadales bacterium]